MPRRRDAVRPYPHQVGGHGQLTVSEDGYLVKPSSVKELAFYSYIYSDVLPVALRWIRGVTPRFYGLVDADGVDVDRFPELNHFNPHNYPPIPLPRLQLSRADSAVSANVNCVRANSNAPSQHSQQQQQQHVQQNSLSSSHPNNTSIAAPAANADEESAQLSPSSSSLRWRMNDGTMGVAISPWAALMTSRRQNAPNPARRPRPSIALEDINREFVLPCVMDCKVGTRHYDDDATEEKRRRHIMKANATTTAKCGVRYTGMQSFKRERHSESRRGLFELRDKYYGRRLREEDLVPEATWFFHDNHRVRADCVHLILDKITELKRLLHAQHHFYFYSSSLLLVYEGALPEVAPPRVDVRMIDFAHTVLSNGSRDDGYLHGINYLIHVLTTVLQNERNGVSVIPSRPLTADAALENRTEPESSGTGLTGPQVQNGIPDTEEAAFEQPSVTESAESQLI